MRSSLQSVFPAPSPFDSRSLVFVVQAHVGPTLLNYDPVELLPRTKPPASVRIAACPPWKIQGVSYSRQVASVAHLEIPVQQAEFEIVVKRRSGLCVWKVFLPMLLMVMVPWTVFE